MGFNINNNYGPTFDVHDGGVVHLHQDKDGLWYTEEGIQDAEIVEEEGIDAPSSASDPEQIEQEEPNPFAPQKNISVMLCQSWFDACSQDKTKFTLDWRESLMEDLMASEYGKEIAKDWTDPEKRTQVKCAIVGALIDAGVLKSSYNALAPELGITAIAAASLAKYMGYGKKQPYYDWLMEYVKK